MDRHTARQIGLLCLGCVGVVGCAGPAPTTRNYSVRHVELRDLGVLYDVVEAALVELGYRIDASNRASGVVSALSASGPVRRRGAPRVSARRPGRTVARLHVEQAPEAIKIYCKVLVQEQVSEAHRMFARDVAGTDTPGETPIERDAATTTKQNTVWRTLRRDTAAERTLLSRILDLSGNV